MRHDLDWFDELWREHGRLAEYLKELNWYNEGNGTLSEDDIRMKLFAIIRLSSRMIESATHVIQSREED